MVNLIQNGSFNTVISPWNLYTEQGTGTATVINGEAKIDVTSIGSGPYGWHYQFYQNGLVLLPNTRYKINFDLYTTNSSKEIEFYIHDNTTYPPNILGIDITATPVKMSHEYFLTTPATVPSNIRMRFKFLTIGTYFIDNVVLEEVPLSTTGSLEVRSNPVGARIYINNIDTLAITPNIITNVQAGQNTLLLTKNGFDDYIDNITVVAGQTITTPIYNLVTSGTNGTLLIESEPTGAKVYIDNTDTLSITPITLTLTPGEHQVKLVLSDYNELIDTANIITGQQTSKIYSLVKKEFSINDLIIPGAVIIGFFVLLSNKDKKS